MEEEEAEEEEEVMEAGGAEVTGVDLGVEEVTDLDVEEAMIIFEEEVTAEEVEEEEELHFEVAEVERRRKFSREKNRILFDMSHLIISQRHALITSFTVLLAVFLHPTRSWQRLKTPFYQAKESISAR